MRGMRSLILAGMVAALGCGGDDDDDDDDDSAADAAVSQPDATPCIPNGIVYLNNQGGDYTVGPDDASANVSQTLDMDRTLAPWSQMGTWDDLVACIGDGLSPFNIQVVDTDPGDVDHTEMVFTETNWVGGGVSAISALDCPAGDRPIGFVFDTGAVVQFTCSVALQQWAVATVSLDHAFRCEDYMTFLSGCGPKTWIDEQVPCGEFEARDCACGGATQNSFETLMDAFGPACQ